MIPVAQCLRNSTIAAWTGALVAMVVRCLARSIYFTFRPGATQPTDTAQHQFAHREQVSPAMTTSDQGCGSEFLSRVMDKYAYERGSKLPELGAWISR